jgi:hypothetical protein
MATTSHVPQAAQEEHLARRAVVFEESDWQEFLTDELGTEVRVRYGRARHQVVRVQKVRGKTLVTLSKFFGAAPRDVREALATWMRSGKRARKATRTLDVWIDERVRELAHEAPRGRKLEPRGAHHDLAQLAAELEKTEFAEEAGRKWPPIGWGRAQASRSRRSLRLGSYDPVDRVVRLHPVLDSADVPRWMVRYIVFHELLHAVLDRPAHDGHRRIIHGPQFRVRERAYPDFARALEWEREHITGLIRAARAGKPFALGKRSPGRVVQPVPRPTATKAVQQLLS